MMMFRKIQPFFFWFLFIGMIVAAFYFQAHTFLNWDVTFLMEAAKRFLAGGTYTQDFFETNPPMIFYLYMPPILLMKYAGLSKAFSLQLFVFLCFLLSISLCYLLGKKLFTKQASFLALILLALTAVLLIFPADEFGQREHFLLILTFPYFFLTAAKIENIPTHLLLSLLIGLLAGIGICIKPHFFILLLLVEGFYLLKKPMQQPWVRPETCMIISVFILYFLSILLFFKEYLTVMLPLIMQLYYAGCQKSFFALFLKKFTFFYFLAFVFYFAYRHKIPSRAFFDVLAVTLIGFLVIHFSQQTEWYYHFYPALSIAFLMICMGIYFFNLELTNQSFSKKLAKTSLITCLLLAPLTLYIFHSTADMLQERKSGWRNDLLLFLKKYPPNTTVNMIATSGYGLPVLDEAKMILASRFPNYWPLAGIMKLKNQSNREAAFFNLITEDLIEKEPRLVLIDNYPYNNELQSRNIDYLTLLKENLAFRQTWKQYRHVASLSHFEVYELLTVNN